MKKIIFSIILFCTISFPQEVIKSNNDLFSPANTKKFADYLFCQRDYLRAIDEYNRYLTKIQSDTIEFKIAIAYSEMDEFKNSLNVFKSIPQNSKLYSQAELEILKLLFQSNNFVELRYKFKNDFNQNEIADQLNNFSYLYTNDALPSESDFCKSFPLGDIEKVRKFYEWKKDPPYKNSLVAGILSAIIPGAGKFYTDKFWDGIWGFISSIGLAYLSYDNFHADHNFRGWLFGGLAVGFYSGNIYGSAASAQIYNAKIKFDFVDGVKSFLESHNYFIPKINFCK